MGRGARRRGWRAAAAAVLLLALAGCTGERGTGAGPPTLNWYVFDEPSGAYQQAAEECGQASGGRYRIAIQPLPTDASDQREQLVRRLAAKDDSIDLIGMDVIWTGEFAEAGWIRPWTGQRAREASGGAIEATVETARYEGQLWAAPFTTNAQLLWYRKDRVEQPPATWAEMIEAAERLGPEGTIEVQGRRYEGFTVWFNTLLESAGGSVLRGSGDDAAVALPPEPTRTALETMRRLATSPAANPSLSNATEDSTRLAFQSGSATFMVNYPFVWPSAQKDAPEVAEQMGWARWPRVVEGEPSHVTLGGINLGVGAFTPFAEEAFDAALCLRSPAHQLLAATKGGLPPTQQALYARPELAEAFPFADVLRATIEDASTRPVSPVYNDISLAIQRTLHPPGGIDPAADVEALRSRVADALESGGLL